MRFAIIAAPLVASVLAQSSESVSSSSSISTPPYSNPNTQYLTQTNSLGVVTGQPTVAGGNVAVTSQPILATVPAGLPTGVTSIPIAVGNGTTPASYFTVSVGSSTTLVLGGVPSGVSVSGVTSAPNSSGTGSSSNEDSSSSDSNASGSNRPSSTNSDGTSPTESADADSSTGAAVANNMVGASGAVLGLGAFIAAML